jgi:bacillithiol system protein YtxJ
MMEWQTLTTPEQLSTILAQSHTKPQVIFKHSTRCNVSSVAKARLEKGPAPANIDFHYLDLIAHRSLSNQIAGELDVYHESPQVLLVQNGQCIYDESHLGIRMEDILSELEAGG